MAFNNWPYTNFQDLNLGWILAKIKVAVTSSAAALAKAEAVETEVGTYSQRISDVEDEAESATNTANAARNTANNAQTDATSGIAMAQEAQNSADSAQDTADSALSNANSALSIANAAADSADLAVDNATDAARDAATALQLANLASEDYLNVGITVYPSDSPQADRNADQILAAVTANKKIKFTVDDARTGETHTTYDYTIDPVDNTSSDIDINVIFDVSVSSSLNKYIIVTFHKVVSGGNTTYSITTTDVSFSGGGGGSISIQDVIDTVNDGDTNALLSTAQTLSAAEKAQVKQNLGITGGGSSGMTQIPITSSGGVYSTTMTATELLDCLTSNGCFAVVNGVYYVPVGGSYSGPYGNIYMQSVDQSSLTKTDVSVLLLHMDNSSTPTITVTLYEKDVLLNGAVPYIPISASSASIPALEPNTLVEYTGDATSLAITLATPSNNSISNEYHFIFHSGSTPTTLTIPNTVRQPDGFTVEANHVYEVSILDNNMLAYGWAVSA